MKRSLIAVFFIAILTTFQVFADPADSAGEINTAGIKTSVFGCMHYSVGQLEHGTYKGAALSHLWLQRLVGDLTLKVQPSERVTLYLGAELDLNYSIKEYYLYMETMIRYVNIYPFHFEGVFSVLDNPNNKLDIGVGTFPYKYNSESRDLGEYLFRSSCYPPNLSTAFDFSEAWLMGLRIHNKLYNNFTQDLLITTETNYPPVHDYSLSYIVSGKIGSVLELGAGVSFYHLLSVNESQTTPPLIENMYVDSSKTPPDTGYYTFSGTKLMGRFCFDPKAFFSSALFGKEDLRLYSEVAVLGLENYPGYYSKRYQRTPIMVGFNLPCFKILDVLAVEGEYYANPYANSYANELPAAALDAQPVATPVGEATFTDDNWKWSVYAKKTFLKKCSFVFQIADDHMRTREANLNVADMEEALHHGDWYYMCKVKFTF